MNDALKERVYHCARELLRPTLIERDTGARFDREAWLALGSTGLFQGMAPKRAGGLELSCSEHLEVLVSLGRGGLDIPFGVSVVAHLIGVDLVASFGSADLKARNLAPLLRGERIAAVCNSEVGAGTNLKNIRAKLERTAEGLHVLNAHKSYATNLSQADVAILSAVSPENLLQVFAVEDRSAQNCHNDRLMGFCTGATGDIVLKNFEIDPERARLGGVKDGFLILRRTFDLERLMIPAVILGVLEAFQASALEHLKARFDEGNDLASKQYIQQKVVTLFTARMKLRAMLGDIAARMNLQEIANPQVNADLSLLKMSSIEDGLAAAEAYYELLGSASFQRQSTVQKVIRDLLGLKFLGGTQELHKMMLFRELAPWCKA